MKFRKKIQFKLLPLFFIVCYFFYAGSLIFSKSIKPNHQNANESLVVPGKAVIRIKGNTHSWYKPSSRIADIQSNAQFSVVEQKIGLYKIESLIEPNYLQDVHNITPLDEFFIIHYDKTQPYEYVAKQVLTIPDVISVEPVTKKRISFVPNDPVYYKQYYLPQIQAASAWDKTKGISSVIIAIVDNGFDMQHSDLISNYWTNSIEKNGQSGVDDDGNGFIDDIHGYDFANDDGDPDAPPAHSHGSHVAGIAAAAGNNNLGIAGVAFHCSILPIKASFDNEPGFIQVDAAIRGIVYAIEQGAKVINMSYGSYSSLQYEKEVINMAYRNGVVLVAAAGNDDSPRFHYPSSYHHVMSVAAVNRYDYKAGFSNYGKSVDIAAPGVDIFSTIPTNSYDIKSGTSMASPIVAGVAALVYSLHPDWNVDQVIQHVVLSAETIDNQNPGFPDQLGTGRVNAFRAVDSETILIPPPAKIVLNRFVVNDSLMGNGNHVLEDNETIAIFLDLANMSLGISPALQVEISTVNNVNLAWQNQNQIITAPADSDFSVNEPFLFTLPDSMSFDHIQFIIRYSGQNVAASEDTVRIQTGRYPVLLVDDDDGLNNVEGFYTTALQELNVPYARWDHLELGTPSEQYISQFPIVIWCCEWTFPSLTEADRSVIASYLAKQGNLFLTGQDIGWDLADPSSNNATEDARDFYLHTLKARYSRDDAEENRIFGEPGDPIGDDLQFTIYQPGRENEYQYPDVFAPVDSAQKIWNYINQKGVGGLWYNGKYKLVYFGFGYEAINAQYNSPPFVSDSIRTEVMKRVLNFLHPLRHKPVTDLLIPVSDLEVSAKYVGTGLPPQNIRLFYQLKNDADFHQAAVTRNENQIKGNMPLDFSSGTVRYYFEIDDPKFHWFLPVSGKAAPFAFRIGEDTQPPVIYHSAVKSQLALLPQYVIHAKIEDNAALDTSQSFLYYFRNNEPVDSSQFNYQPEIDQFVGTIAGDFHFGEKIHYFIKTKDMAIQPHYAVSDTFQFVIGFDDFETGLQNWIFSSSDWDLDTTQTYSGHFAVSTNPGGYYEDNVDTWFATRDTLDFHSASTAQLRFYSRYHIESGDAGYVKLKSGSEDWQIIAGPYSGLQSSWKQETINLDAFVGQSQLVILFRFISDSQQNIPVNGWSIDHVQILQDDLITSNTENPEMVLPRDFILHPVYPNPFREEMYILFELPTKTKPSIFIFNILGQRVKTMQLNKMESGTHRLVWDGLDDNGSRLPAGIYLLQVRVLNRSKVQKFLLVR